MPSTCISSLNCWKPSSTSPRATSVPTGTPGGAWTVLFLIASLAELNQTPFDMSEAESELVAGFANEYSGMKFAFMFLAEFSNSFIVSALGVTLFFGGWLVPFVSAEAVAPIAPIVFLIKTYLGIFVLMWIRGTLPRIRIDQLLAFGWKGLIPVSLGWVLVVGLMVKLVGGVS